MSEAYDPFGPQADKRAQGGTDRPERAARLAPEVIDHWTRLIRRAVPHVGVGSRPCEYAPWVGALREARRVPSFVGPQPLTHHQGYPDLMAIAEDIAQPGRRNRAAT